jgi:Ca2+-transporting ATPase
MTTTAPSSPWHAVSAEEALTALESDASTGLSSAEALRRQALHGANRLAQKPAHGPLRRFLRQFNAPLIHILNASALISALFGEWVDACVIFGVVLVNAVIGHLQESRAEGALAALARIVTTHTLVLRDGSRQNIPAEQLVPGDVVWLAAGDKVPADLRLVAARDLRVDESMLTGESLPVAKHADTLAAATSLAERANMAYAGTLVTAGHGVGLVVAIGGATETGRIARLVANTDVLATPLTRKLAHFSNLLLYAILALAALTFAVGLARGERAFDMFMAAVALAVGAIPEGLPAAVTVTLAIGVARMARRRAIVRKLPAVETLGGTTVICSDKTGTLTQNRMTVESIHAGGHTYAVDDVAGAPTPALRQCLVAGVLCNDAGLQRQDGQWRSHGDPTEVALLLAAANAGLDVDAMRRALLRTDTLPFDAARQAMATLHVPADGQGRHVLYAKGAVERILPCCTRGLAANGEEIPLDRLAIEAAAAEMARHGLRVLALACKETTADALETDAWQDGLVFLGLQGMRDPPRPEAIAAVAACRRAGIAVKMITGDHAATAAAIARAIGLADEGAAPLTGQEIAALSDAALAQAVGATSVFARVEPEQKLRLVKALQSQGHVVAMTGDGVNDAPALRQADIGVAMGHSGTEVTKEAADMVLTDDNFATIVAAVEEGRGIFDNLVKFIVWTLPTNFGEGLVITAAVLLGTALPILPVQILWINMTTAVLLGLMLAFEPIEKDVMNRPPRPPHSPLLTPALLRRMALVSLLLLVGAFGLFSWETHHGASLPHARTVAANMFVMGETFYLFNCRSLTRSMFAQGVFSNRWVTGGVALMLALQLVFTYHPAMNAWFGTAPLNGADWLGIVAAGVLIHALVGVEKWFSARSRHAD